MRILSYKRTLLLLLAYLGNMIEVMAALAE